MVKNKADLCAQVIAYLEKKHSITIGDDEEMELGGIGEGCGFSLMFELAEHFGVDESCDGDELNDGDCIYHAVDAIWNFM